MHARKGERAHTRLRRGTRLSRLQPKRSTECVQGFAWHRTSLPANTRFSPSIASSGRRSIRFGPFLRVPPVGPQPQPPEELGVRRDDHRRDAHRDRAYGHREVDPPCEPRPLSYDFLSVADREGGPMTAKLIALFTRVWVKFAGATRLTSTCCPPCPFCG